MAVHKRSYHGYAGDYTPEWSRFLVISRYASKGVFRSKALTGFFVLCLFPFLIAAAMIYLSHSAGLLSLLKIRGGLFSVDAEFFRTFLSFQVALAFFLSAFIGPGLISPDLSNNALVLHFCRPFSRTEYVLGKFAVLAAPALLHHLDPRPGALRHRSQPVRLGLAVEPICTSPPPSSSAPGL